MKEVKTGPNPLFLREEELRYGLELLFFANRDMLDEATPLASRFGLGPAQMRMVYFVAATPHIGVKDLREALGITKQSLSRALGPLLENGLVVQRKGLRDGRERYLELTRKGQEIEREITRLQTRRFARAYAEAGAEAVEGFCRVMAGLLDKKTRERIRPRSVPNRLTGPGGLSGKGAIR